MSIFLEILQDNMAPVWFADRNAWPLQFPKRMHGQMMVTSVHVENLYEGPLDDIHIEV